MKSSQLKAFTLIETIAVIGAIAALAAALLVPMMRRLDHLAREKEAKALAQMAAAFKERVATVRTIPNESGWAASVAAVTGQQLNVITANERGLARIFLIDPLLRIGVNTSPSTYSLPYTQTVLGHTYTNGGVAPGVVPPISPRLMIVSSVSVSLPTSLVSGVGIAGSGPYSFTNVWKTLDGQVPAGWTWAGRGDDLKIQRIDLSDMFVQVALNNRDSTATATYPSYQVSTGPTSFGSANVPRGCWVPMYFLKGSEIQLYNIAGTMEYSEILFQSKAFTFEFGTWEPESYIATSVGQPTPMDLQKAFNLFMASPTNVYANAGASQTTVSNAMMNFLTNYIAWRNDGYPLSAGSKPPAALDAAQTALQNATTDLIDYR
jgi:type II secretory pathway pseudopilin PulG